MPAPDARKQAVGWAFPALFHVPDAATWVLLTEAGTDESYCACHLNPNCSNGVYQIAFPLADETTRGYTNKFGPEPRFTLPWTIPWLFQPGFWPSPSRATASSMAKCNAAQPQIYWCSRALFRQGAERQFDKGPRGNPRRDGRRSK